ncbi:MAG TPA: response regulator transcription factor, partial [Stackebrandtia sp.]|uniref:helix-turn-helix transcriptional regulator n=1 Tax=Stackebrandtia sp. TaxID=2023065 RepID=UPI002D4D0EDA
SYAYVEEAHHLDRVLELWEAVPDAAERLGLDRAEVCVHAAECCMLSGDYPRGIAYATAGLGFVDEAREPERAARLLEYRGRLRDRTDATGMADLERSYDLFVLASKAAGHGRGAAAGANDREPSPEAPTPTTHDIDPGRSRDHDAVTGTNGRKPPRETGRGRSLGRGNVADTNDREPSPEAPTPTTWDIDRGRLLGLRAMATVRADAEAAFALGTEALVIGRRTADPTVTIRGLLVVGAVTSHLDLLAEALSITEDIRDHDLMITALMYLAIHHGRHGDQPSSARAAAEGMRRAQRLGLARSRGTHLAGYLAKAQLLSGRADAAAATVNEALAEDPPPMSAGILHAVEAHVAVLRGDLDTASELAERLSLDDERLGTHFFHRCQVLALVALARGESARVGELLDTALANPSFRVVPAVELRPLLLVAALNPDTVARAADLSRSLPVDGLLDAAYHELIDALTTSGASDAWGSVIPVWRERGHPWELALSLGFAARAADRADTSGSLRTEAEAIAERLGAQKLYAALVPAPEFDAARSELSQRELEVLALIAEGLSNRQIAAKLYISPSTAGVHVSHILTKLGAANRTEAATIAHQRGLV